MSGFYDVLHYDSLVASRSIPGGNKAGVVHVDEGFPEDGIMQQVAKEVGFSETAFVWRPKTTSNDVHVRFFTPEGEVDLCGHATVAVFSAMPRNYNFNMKTIKATLSVSTDEHGRVVMEQRLPIIQQVEEPMIQLILDALGLQLDDTLAAEIPFSVVSTGLPDLFIGVKSRAILLDAMKPDMEKIKNVSKALETIGFHVFTLDAPDGYSAECRNFAPLYGIDEEAATGTSSGALGALLCHYKKSFSQDGTQNFTFSQGNSMNLPSKIEAIIRMDHGQIQRVSIAGIAQHCGSQRVGI